MPNFNAATWGKLPFDASASTVGGLSSGQMASNASATQALLRSGRYGASNAQSAMLHDIGKGGGGSSNSWQDAWDAARKANEDRFNKIVGEYDSRYKRNVQDLESQGGHERTRLDQQYDRLNASNDQSLVGGAFNSTVRGNMRAGVERERADAMSGLDQKVRGQRVAVDSALSKDKLDFMERRNDNYPDQNLMAQLFQQFGRGGGGGFPGIFGGVEFGNGGYQMPGAMYGGWGTGQMPMYQQQWGGGRQVQAPGGAAAAPAAAGGGMWDGIFGGLGALFAGGGGASGGGTSIMPYDEGAPAGYGGSGGWGYDPNVGAGQNFSLSSGGSTGDYGASATAYPTSPPQYNSLYGLIHGTGGTVNPFQQRDDGRPLTDAFYRDPNPNSRYPVGSARNPLTSTQLSEMFD